MSMIFHEVNYWNGLWIEFDDGYKVRDIELVNKYPEGELPEKYYDLPLVCNMYIEDPRI